MISQKNKRFDVQNIDLKQNSKTIFLVEHRSLEIMPSVLTTQTTKINHGLSSVSTQTSDFTSHLLWLSMSFPRAQLLHQIKCFSPVQPLIT